MRTTYEKVRSFLFEEAHLLDDRRFEDWLALFDKDALYWMPCRPNAKTLHVDSAIIEDKHSDIEMRVRRLSHPAAHTEAPPPHGVRSISNIVVLSETEDTVEARAKLVMHEFQRRAYTQHDDYRLFAATLYYTLLTKDDSYAILQKQVHLVDGAGARTVMATPL